MDKNQIIEIIKKYLSKKFECDASELDKSGLSMVKNNSRNKLRMLLFYDLVLVSSSEDIYEYVSENISNKNVYEIFEFPLVYGQSIYYVPDVSRMKPVGELLGYKFRLFDGNTGEIELSSGFENAISFDVDGRCNSSIAYCAYQEGKIVGVAGADKINDDMWEVGIEVLPEFRKSGLATFLTQNLTMKILEKGIVPIWCASSTNVGSQAVASRSNYIPLWVESFGDIFDDNYVYKNAKRGKVIAICGKIASGKSYYANQIKEQENAIILNNDELTYAMFDNEQGDKYTDLANRANEYLLTKAVACVNVGCNVILDWGFWQKYNRDYINDYFKKYDVKVEWHYVHIDDASWQRNIEERNHKIEAGQNKTDFFVTEGLKKKLLDNWEEPSQSEIDVWYELKRN